MRFLTNILLCVLVMCTGGGSAYVNPVTRTTLSEPLDTATVFYRATAYSPTLTQIEDLALPSDAALQLGPTLGAETMDPTFVQEPFGDFLRFTLNQGQYAFASVNAEVLNGDVTISLGYRPATLWADRLLLAIIDPHPTTPLKRFILHQTSGNKIMVRFWANNPNNSQIFVISTLSVSLSRTDIIEITWNDSERKLCLYMNGVLQGSVISPYDRSPVVSSPLWVAYPATILKPSGWYGPLAIWEYSHTPEEALALVTCPDWN
jgi:hypothetical protein